MCFAIDYCPNDITSKRAAVSFFSPAYAAHLNAEGGGEGRRWGRLYGEFLLHVDFNVPATAVDSEWAQRGAKLRSGQELRVVR